MITIVLYGGCQWVVLCVHRWAGAIVKVGNRTPTIYKEDLQSSRWRLPLRGSVFFVGVVVRCRVLVVVTLAFDREIKVRLQRFLV